MKAVVWLHGVGETGTTTLSITHVYTDSGGTYGEIRYKGKKYEVCQDTTVKHADGREEKQWSIVNEIKKSTGYISDDIEDW